MPIKVLWEDYDSQPHERECEDMRKAMELSKHLKDKANITVTIQSEEFFLVGSMGSGIVMGGKLPDGNDYTWTKRRGDIKWKGRRK